MPARDVSQFSMASAVQTRPSKVPYTKTVKLGAALEPRMGMPVLRSVVEKVIDEDAILKKA
eukprot:8355604-Prorocentrum_lima.AAC.1